MEQIFVHFNTILMKTKCIHDGKRKIAFQESNKNMFKSKTINIRHRQQGTYSLGLYPGDLPSIVSLHKNW